MITTLALDLGTKTGWAIDHNDVRLSGVWDLAPSSQRRYEGGGMRYLRFHTRLRDLHGVDRVVYEEIRRHAGTSAAHIYGGLQAILTTWAEIRKIPYEAIPNGQIKKHATGKGNASKTMMCAAFRQAVGRDPVSSDEADAWWLLDLAVRE